MNAKYNDTQESIHQTENNKLNQRKITLEICSIECVAVRVLNQTTLCNRCYGNEAEFWLFYCSPMPFRAATLRRGPMQFH